MALPPSYQEATLKPDIWKILSEHLVFYITSDDHGSLCQVSHHFNELFNPLLWKNPIKIIFSGRRNRMERFAAFHKNTTPRAEIVRIMDFRQAQENPNSPVLLEVSRKGPRFTSHLHFAAYPRLKFVIMDNTDIRFHPPIPGSPGHIRPENEILWSLPRDYPNTSRVVNHQMDMVILFSAARCPNVFPPFMMWLPFCYTILYLDLSYVTSVVSFTSSEFPLERLTRLRILKLRGTGLSNSGLERIGQIFAGYLWSLDVRDNMLNSMAADVLDNYFCYQGSVTDRYLPLNGQAAGSIPLPAFVEIPLPSLYSFAGDVSQTGTNEQFVWEDSMIRNYFPDGNRWNPERYVVDPPSYVEAVDYQEEQATVGIVNSVSEFRPDTTDEVIKWYYKHPDMITVYDHPEEIGNSLTERTGLTHLYISGNKIPAERFLQKSSQLQLLDCDNLQLFKRPTPTPFYTRDRLLAFTSEDGSRVIYKGRCKDLPHNLEILRIHHSLVTKSDCFAVTTHLSPRKRVELEDLPDHATNNSYLTFRPNQNPKLRELTLTDIPRKSLGRVVSSLKFLIHFAADQEQHLKEMAKSPEFKGRRAPKLLPGLRLIRLEFRKDEALGKSTTGDLDAENFAQESAKDFSFFNDDGGGKMEGKGEEEKDDDLADLRDVAEELKAFRGKTRRGEIDSPFWSGVLQFAF